ncbi:MAG: phosphatase PAP2 family protein [Paludibacteraceae bacterium]|nr:phosphatase PAP2 family protein [Paludibacteraceae bacterium]
MKDVLKQNAVFTGLSLILIAVLGLALLYIPKGELHLLLCDRHTYARDIFYRYYTQIAEWFPYLLCVGLLFYRAGAAALTTAGVALSGLCTQIIKHVVNAPRPLTWFATNYPDIQLPLVEGVHMSKYYSFPSGHTTTFFALAFALSIILTSAPVRTRLPKITSWLLQAILFFLAALGGYSRIYLSQHFALDVFAGTLVGILITLLSYTILVRFQDKKWFNYRLFQKK